MSGRALMNRLRYQVSIAVAVMGLCAFTAPALAHNNQHPVTLPQDQTVNHDYFAAGSMVEVDGTVNGDVYAAGGQVTINGTVNGDVLAAGGTVTIDGTVNGNVRTAGGSIVIDGRVGKNVSGAGGTIEVGRNATVGGNLAVAAGTLTDSGTISGDANAAAGNLTVGSAAHIGGTLTYWSNQPGSIAQGAVAGVVTHRVPPEHHNQNRSHFGSALLMALYWFVVTYILAVLAMLWLPRHSSAITEALQKRPWQSFGWGILVAILTPLAGLVLLITVIGIPFGLALWAFYAVALLLAPVWVIMATRELLSGQFKRENTFVVLLLAAFIYTLIGLIPIVGAIFIIVTSLMGLGASVTSGFGAYRHLRQKNEL